MKEHSDSGRLPNDVKSRITVSQDSNGVFWVGRSKGRSKVSTMSNHYEGAIEIARREFMNAGGKGKAVVVDLVKRVG